MDLKEVLLIGLTLLTNNPKVSICPKQIKVAIVDSGLDLKDPRFEGHICRTGHFNYTNFSDTNLTDTHGHGTHVAGLIQKYAGIGNYCFLIYNYYSSSQNHKFNMESEVRSFRKAIKEGAEIVNFSSGGPFWFEPEFQTIKDHPEVTFVMAAGNEGQDLDIPGNEYFPASYDLPNIVSVGAVDKNGKKTSTSNYGKWVTARELGMDVMSFLPEGMEGTMSGTSQATAIHTGKLIRNKLNQCDIGIQQ